MIEMMISIAIGLMIIAALVGVLASNAGNSKTNERTAEIQSNGRFALDLLEHELRLAGFRGFHAGPPDTSGVVMPAIASECGTAGNFVKNIRQAVWGANDSNPFSASCLSSANAKYNTAINSDVLVIRRGTDTATLKAAAIAGTLYINSSYDQITLLQGSALPADSQAYENSALQINVFYIGTDDNDATVPALRRVFLSGTSMAHDEMVVSGIEELQVEYGITDPVSGLVQYSTASNIGTAGDDSSTTATPWENVSSVRIWVLARSAKAEPGYANPTSYTTMSDKIHNVAADGIRRQVLSSVVQLRNFKQ